MRWPVVLGFGVLLWAVSLGGGAPATGAAAAEPVAGTWSGLLRTKTPAYGRAAVEVMLEFDESANTGVARWSAGPLFQFCEDTLTRISRPSPTRSVYKPVRRRGGCTGLPRDWWRYTITVRSRTVATLLVRYVGESFIAVPTLAVTLRRSA